MTVPPAAFSGYARSRSLEEGNMSASEHNADVEKGDSRQGEFLGTLAIILMAVMALFVILLAVAGLKG